MKLAVQDLTVPVERYSLVQQAHSLVLVLLAVSLAARSNTPIREKLCVTPALRDITVSEESWRNVALTNILPTAL